MNDFDFDVEESSTSEAKEVEQTTGSKYEPIAEKWRTARSNDKAVILRGVEKNVVDNIRNYFYRAFDKEDVIVRSKARDQDDTYNVTIRPREDGEYLQNGSADSSEDPSMEEEDTTETPAEDTVTEENTSEESTPETESVVDQAEEDMEDDEDMEKAENFF